MLSYLVATTAFVKGAVMGAAIMVAAGPCVARMCGRRR
jgi:hypothetical protein